MAAGGAGLLEPAVAPPALSHPFKHRRVMSFSPSFRLVALLVAFAAIASSAMFAAAADGRTRSATASDTSTIKATVALKKTGLGAVLVDARGRTLYLFLKDKNRQSLCAGSCAQFWPPLLSTGKPSAGPGVRQRLLGLTKASRQVTYAGHPLYTFVADTKPGQTNGEGSNNFGAAWYVLGANGRAIKAAPSGAGG
jgi:predicted lipoprotein with Yx(FWY)xxD motif